MKAQNAYRTDDISAVTAVKFLMEQGKTITIDSLIPFNGYECKAKGQTNVRPNYLVYNVAHNKGFVIVSGDIDNPIVLGYNDSGKIDYIPSEVDYWLGNSSSLELSSGSKLINNKQVKSVRTKCVYPLLSCKWNQIYPYNAACPIIRDSLRALTGCVATAMGQVLYYYRNHPKTLSVISDSIFAYKSYYPKDSFELYVEGVQPGFILHWDDMVDELDGNSSISQINAVSGLLNVCGRSILMHYGLSESGCSLFNVLYGLKDYFGYRGMAFGLKKSNYADDEWNQVIYEEMINERPVLYAGGDADSHAFVVDGYSLNDYFHVNWGWGGNCDGYYLLSYLHPKSMYFDFSTDAKAIVGIVPGNYVKSDGDVRVVSIAEYNNKTSFTRRNNSDDFVIAPEAVLKADFENNELYDLGFSLYNRGDSLCCCKWNTNFSFNFNALNYFGPYPNLIIPGKLGDGVYNMFLIYKKSSSSEWKNCLDNNKHYLVLEIRGDTIYISKGTETTGISKYRNMNSSSNFAYQYNIFGQKVGKGYKGFVIRNGKKIVYRQ